jgi:drug/metabolite transporter (DMT)-like permease
MTISLLPLLMAVAVGALYGVFDLLRKRLTTAMPPAAMLVWLALGQVPLFALVVWRAESFDIQSGYWLPGLLSIVLNIIANLAFIRALEIAPLGVTVPLLSLTPVFATLLSMQLLGELPSSVQMLGIVLVVMGAFALNFDPGEGATPAGVWRSLVREKGSLLMILVALCWSVTPAFDKLAVTASGVFLHGLLLNAGVGLGALLWLLLSGQAKTLKPRHFVGGALALSALVGFVALVLLLKAYAVAWVGFVETIRRAVNSGLALFFGWWLFKERIRTPQIVAVLLMTLGVALIFVQ